jgi:hypothetical protein
MEELRAAGGGRACGAKMHLLQHAQERILIDLEAVGSSDWRTLMLRTAARASGLCVSCMSIAMESCKAAGDALRQLRRSKR